MNSSITGNGTSHIYYNITLTNNDNTENQSPPPVSFTETRNTPYLNCPSDYFLSVVRFQLETPTLPVMTCQPSITDPTIYDELVYRVSLTYDGVTKTQPLIFVPQNSFISPPKIPLQPNDIQNTYYNIYNYQWFILMVNVALEYCFQQFTTLPATFTAPFLGWDLGGNIAIMQQNVVNETKDGDGFGLRIYFNTPLYTLFSSFVFFSELIPFTTTPEVGHKLLVDTSLNAIISSITDQEVPPVTRKYYNIVQEYSTVPLWTPVDSIVFTTSMIPILPELSAAPVQYNDNGVFISTGTNANLTTVLTDFIVPLTTGGEYKPSINYTPSSEYRLVDLFGTSPVSSIQVNVFYKNRFGTLIPLTLGSGCSASIKIMFRRKDFSNLIVNN